MTTLETRPIIDAMQVEVRPFSGSLRDWYAAVEVSFGDRPNDEDLAAFEAETELDRALAAYAGERVVGTAGAFSFELTVPGARLPAAGVTMVGVDPTQRRRGILTGMMRAQLAQVREHGEPIAVLWASEGAIYGRFGYGLASFRATAEIDRARAGFRDPLPPRGSFRLIEADEVIATFGPIYERFLPMRSGAFSRSLGYWQGEILYDPERWRRGGGPAWYLLHETDGVGDGYARYRIRGDWDERGPKGAIEVLEAIAVTPDAERELWSYLLNIDLTASIRARNLPVDTPLRFFLAEPRRLGLTVSDGLWLRLVDLPRALERRGYAGRDRLVLEVRDAFLPENDGRWELEAMPDGARVAPCTSDPDLVLAASDLGATYLGGVRFAELALAGRIEECTPGAIMRADALFTTPLLPWCPGMF